MRFVNRCNINEKHQLPHWQVAYLPIDPCDQKEGGVRIAGQAVLEN
jgi:hypothetical protein